MGAARKPGKSTARPSWLSKSVSLLRGPAGPFVWIGMLVVLLFGAWCLAWLKVSDRIFSSDEHVVGPQQVEILTPLPEWIHTDVRSEAFRHASLEGPLSIMDDRLTERIASAFSLNPWVAEVLQVRKFPPARVEVELVYRRPVCMVEAFDDLLPVDAHGVLLPYGSDDFSSIEKSRYPRLVGITTAPVGTVGECWSDVRVVGGAEIAAALGEVWGELKLQQIVPSAPLATGVAEEPTYTLITRGGTRISWGRSPGTDVPGELPAAEKIARLRRYIQQYGTLEGADGPQELNLFSPRISSRSNP